MCNKLYICAVNIEDINMRFCSILFLILFSLPVVATDTTRINKWSQRNMGAFGGFGFGYTEMASREAIEINLQGGIIYNHWLAAGIYLNPFFTISPLTDKYTNDDASLLGGYGGLFVSPIIYSNALIHATVPVYLGYGNVSYELYDDVESTNRIEDSGRFWVFNPGVEVELNVLRFVRVAVGGYYRYCGNVRLYYDQGGDQILSSNFLNGFSLGVKLRFGKF